MVFSPLLPYPSLLTLSWPYFFRPLYYINIVQGFSFKGKDFVGSGNPLVRMGNFTQSYNLSFTKDNTKYFDGLCNDKFHLKPGDLVICLSDVTQQGLLLGNPSFIPDDERQYLLNQRVAKIIPKNIPSEFLFCVFSDIRFKKWVVDSANSTTVLNTSSGAINEFKFTEPDSIIIQSFASIFSEIICQLTNNISENNNLIELRENLLPKLISGRIRT
jgi:type I restriction enzyme S subunit